MAEEDKQLGMCQSRPQRAGNTQGRGCTLARPVPPTLGVTALAGGFQYDSYAATPATASTAMAVEMRIARSTPPVEAGRYSALAGVAVVIAVTVVPPVPGRGG